MCRSFKKVLKYLLPHHLNMIFVFLNIAPLLRTEELRNLTKRIEDDQSVPNGIRPFAKLTENCEQAHCFAKQHPFNRFSRRFSTFYLRKTFVLDVQNLCYNNYY